MKKTIALMLCLLLALTALVACGGAQDKAAAGDDSLKKITDAGKLVLGLDDAYPPYGYKDEDGVIKGFDIDLAKEVCSRMGVELVTQPINWDTKVVELNNGNIDCIWSGFTITEELKKQVNFTDPYVNNRQIIVVAAGSDIKSKADLSGKLVGVQAGSSAIEAIDAEADVKATFKELIEIKDNVTALIELKNGTVEAVVLDEAVGMSYVNDGTGTYRVLDEDFGGEQYGVGFRLADNALRDKVNETLAAMRKDGTIEKIAKDWPDVTGAILK